MRQVDRFHIFATEQNKPRDVMSTADTPFKFWQMDLSLSLYIYIYIYVYNVFEWDLKLDSGREELSPLISGTFPLQRARDVVAWARGAKSGVDFFGMPAPLKSVSSNFEL